MAKRRPHGDGTLSQRGKDRWQVQVRLGRDPVSGNYGRLTETVRGTKTQATRRLRELQRQVETGTTITPETVTVGEYLERWICDYAAPNVAPSTLKSYREKSKWWAQLVGSVRLRELKGAHIQTGLRRLSQGESGRKPRSAQTVVHHYRMLHLALKHAVKWQLIPVNPAEAVTPPRPEKLEVRVLSRAEFHELLDALRDPQHRCLVNVAVQTGARIGELLALRWRDLDLPSEPGAEGTMSINRSLSWLAGSGPEFRTPKTAHSRRSIALSEDTVTALREQRAWQLGSDHGASNLVFANALGEPLRPGNTSRDILRVARKAGLEALRFHDLRHTAATFMLGLGVPVKVVSERLGHASTSITNDLYAHVTPDMGSDAVRRMDEFLRGSS